LDLFYLEVVVVVSLSSTILDTATKPLKNSDLVVTQSNNNLSGYKFFFKIDLKNSNTTVLKIEKTNREQLPF